MKKKYTINVAKLEPIDYHFDMEGDSTFFEDNAIEQVFGGDFKAHLVINKSETMIVVDLALEGILQLECDRSLESFDFPFDSNDKIIYKFGSGQNEDEEIRWVTKGIESLDLEQDIYELILLSIPMKKLHPRFVEEGFDSEVEGKVVYSTIKPTDEQEQEQEIDPRWANLNKLK